MRGHKTLPLQLSKGAFPTSGIRQSLQSSKTSVQLLDTPSVGIGQRNMITHASDKIGPTSTNSKLWRPDDIAHATPAQPGSNELYRPDMLEMIDEKIN